MWLTSSIVRFQFASRNVLGCVYTFCWLWSLNKRFPSCECRWSFLACHKFHVILGIGRPPSRWWTAAPAQMTVSYPLVATVSKRKTPAGLGRAHPVLAAAGRAHLATVRVELAHLQLTIAWTEPVHAHLALHLPSSPWLGRNLPARSS